MLSRWGGRRRIVSRGTAAPSRPQINLQKIGHVAGTELLDRRATVALASAERFLEDGPSMAEDRFSLADIAALTIQIAYEARTEWATFAQAR
jgi:GSH-dependent disulfide-bond oxidoreductase